MYGYIYLTINLINNKKYIGQHKANEFTSKYKGSGKILIKAFKKYGIENFSVELLQECNSRDELNEAEKYWISKYNATADDNFYNVSEGGEGHCCEPWNKGKKGVQKCTDKMKEALLRGSHLPASAKLKQKLSEYRKSLAGTDIPKTLLNKKCINDGKHNKYVYPEEIDKYLQLGYKLGTIRNYHKK